MVNSENYTLEENPLVEAHEVVMDYRVNPTEHVRALDGLSLSIWRGEFVAILGPEGSGKSTLIQLLGCLDRPTSGTIRIDNEMVTELPTNRLAGVRRDKMGFLFQVHHLVPTLVTIENVMLPLRYRKMPHKKAEQLAGEWLVRVGLHDRMYHRPSELTGSEQQRAALARALVNDPLIIFCDEPTADLSMDAAQELIELMRGLNYEFGQTYVLATESEDIAAMCDRIVRISEGRITADTGLPAASSNEESPDQQISEDT
ncbi:MAG: ABC transporter ATP-binding protein [Limnochordia bacterium]